MCFYLLMWLQGVLCSVLVHLLWSDSCGARTVQWMPAFFDVLYGNPQQRRSYFPSNLCNDQENTGKGASLPLPIWFLFNFRRPSRDLWLKLFGVAMAFARRARRSAAVLPVLALALALAPLQVPCLAEVGVFWKIAAHPKSSKFA